MSLIKDVEKIRKFNRYYANTLGRIDQEIYNGDFPLTEARVINEIYARSGCTATEVREALGIDRGYMSRIIQRFEEDKIIIKKQSVEDKRQYQLFLTKYGEEIHQRLVEDANREVSKMVQGISKAELSTLVNSMEKIENIFSNDQPSKPKVSIRPFKRGDAGYVVYLHGKLYSGEEYNFTEIFDYYVMKGLTEFIIDNEGGNLWVAEVDGEIAGSIAVTKSSDGVAQLRWFILDNQYQGLGIGKKLIETALNFCKEQGYQQVFLWTVSILGAARHLYRKYGFERTEEKPNDEWTENTIIEERWDFFF